MFFQGTNVVENVVEGIVLDVRSSEDKSVSTRSFKKMRCLKLLQINGVHLTGPFTLLSEELIWFCWLECPLKYFPSNLTLDNLVILDMQYSNIKELWNQKKVRNRLQSPEICALCNLYFLVIAFDYYFSLFSSLL